MKLFQLITLTFLIGSPVSSLENNKVIEKIGFSCPTGFYASGGFCKAYKNNKRSVILNRDRKNCPSGYFSSANYYCLSY